jgi:methyltransferase
MVSAQFYTLAIVAIGCERLVELAISRRNAKWARARGAVEYGQGHLRWMKLLHTAFLLGCVLEVWLASRLFVPWLCWSCAALVLASQGLRYWTIATLGRRWNIAVLVLPDVPAEAKGPFRFVRHPNYLAVIVEGVAIPLAHSAFITAAVFSVLNAYLLRVRIRCEEQALARHSDYEARLGARRRFLPFGSGRA